MDSNNNDTYSYSSYSSYTDDDSLSYTSSYTNNNGYYYYNRNNGTVSLVVSILMIIALWKIFTKAGEKGWKAIIPFYDTYVLYKLTWEVKYFWIQIGLSVGMIALILVAILSPIIAMVLLFGICVYMIYLSIRQNYYLARSFGEGVGFTFGLVLLGPIFYLILAFSSSKKYLGNGYEINENRKKGVNKTVDSQIV